jgi:hypothetical protein
LAFLPESSQCATCSAHTYVTIFSANKYFCLEFFYLYLRCICSIWFGIICKYIDIFNSLRRGYMHTLTSSAWILIKHPFSSQDTVLQ